MPVWGKKPLSYNMQHPDTTTISNLVLFGFELPILLLFTTLRPSTSSMFVLYRVRLNSGSVTTVIISLKNEVPRYWSISGIELSRRCTRISGLVILTFPVQTFADPITSTPSGDFVGHLQCSCHELAIRKILRRVSAGEVLQCAFTFWGPNL